MAEAIRLVIWDLDETFWKGTLTEGGIEYLKHTHDIVVTLARRGIMSSICSKNDLERVRPILEESGLWEYFIFPSINWEPKGQRIRGIIEDVQLRPATVLFVDDNPMNLKEAQHYVPDIQVADETCIETLLDNPLLKGKDDSALSRLAQYKLLETKKSDEVAAGGDNIEFLRSSDIRIIFEYDVEAHIDRAVELINRTNQLNFTKLRLPEEPEAARTELRTLLSHYQTQAGLVRVVDRYGDYGFVGFYAIKRPPKGPELVHFCFSCRTLNMGIETWMYRRLGSPPLTPVGEVLTDVVNDKSEIDWITVQTAAEASVSKPTGRRFDTIVTRGGCDQRAVAHYLAAHTDQEFGEYNYSRDSINYRIEHSQIVRYAIEGLPEDIRDDVYGLGYVPSDFETALVDLKGRNNLVVLSFWIDGGISVHAHKQTNNLIPFGATALKKILEKKHKPIHDQIKDVLSGKFKSLGMIDLDAFSDNLRAILKSLVGKAYVFVVKGNDKYMAKHSQDIYNAAIDAVVREFDNVRALAVTDHIHDISEVHTFSHFDRMVYFRLYSEIMSSVEEMDAALEPALMEG